MKKLVAATVAAYVVLMGTSYLVNQVLLMPDYDAIPLSHRSNADIMHRFWAMAIGQLFFSAMFAYIYTRGAENKPWVSQGIKYGILMTFLTAIPVSLTEYAVYFIPHMLAVKWMCFGAIQMILLGLVVAGICQEKKA